MPTTARAHPSTLFGVVSMSLGQVRMRPKANKPSIANMSAVEGGLFGREPQTYGQRIVDNPYEVLPHGGGGGYGGGGNLDFLSRVEQAEARDSERQNSARQRKGHRAYVKRHPDGGMMDDGGVVFGDDTAPQNRQHRKQEMYTTSNGATNTAMQNQLEAAVQRQHEQTIRQLLMEQHGLSAKEAERELVLWRQEVASGKAKPIPVPQANGTAGHRARGENGNFLPSQQFEDPFKVRAARSATPPKSKPWDIVDNFKDNRAEGVTAHKRGPQPWEVADAFKDGNSGFGAAFPMTSGGGGQYGAQFHAQRDPNASSISGGIFG